MKRNLWISFVSTLTLFKDSHMQDSLKGLKFVFAVVFVKLYSTVYGLHSHPSAVATLAWRATAKQVMWQEAQTDARGAYITYSHNTVESVLAMPSSDIEASVNTGHFFQLFKHNKILNGWIYDIYCHRKIAPEHQHVRQKINMSIVYSLNLKRKKSASKYTYKHRPHQKQAKLLNNVYINNMLMKYKSRFCHNS